MYQFGTGSNILISQRVLILDNLHGVSIISRDVNLVN